MDKIPHIEPRIYTLSAALIGFALIDDFTANEQNALDNWFLLIGQVLETNSAFKQVNESSDPSNFDKKQESPCTINFTFCLADR